mmetsp:Transcript_161445/g.513009  ORF Transcript_161445/g.513009 Transcript_161445/m.513009 type:complete len:207 (-) Transcript_161445:138-758(-)
MPARRGRMLGALVVGAALCQTSSWLSAFAAGGGAAPRRELIFGAATSALLAGPLAASAVEACKDGANNCYSSASQPGKNFVAPWSWPAGTSKGDAIKALREVLEAYPKEGQGDVDQGGWSLAVDELATKGYARLEYLSGVGNFARFFNGGKPFVDDLEVSVGESSVSVRSGSRVGDSDMGVNTKRLNYLAKALTAKGWTTTQVAPL